MNRTHFAENHPYAFSILLVALIVGVNILVGILITLLNLENESPVYLISDTILAIIAAAMLTRMGWWRTSGLRAPPRPGDLWLYWLPLLPVLENLAGGITPLPLSSIILFFFIALLAGLVEEIYFRGLILHALATRGVWRAVILSSILFGLLHSLNILFGWSPQVVLQQIAVAIAIGFVYAALVLRTGVIWPTMLLHFATDFAGFLAQGRVIPPETTVSAASWVVAGIFFVIFIAYGVVVLVRGLQLHIIEE